MARNRDTGRYQSFEGDFICNDCNFSTSNANTARTHRRREGHEVSQGVPEHESTNMDTSCSFGSEVLQSDHNPLSRPPPISPSNHSPRLENNTTMIDSNEEDALDDDNQSDIDPPLPDANDVDDWHPFKNFTHFLLCLLFHGSHNHKISVQTIKVLLLGFQNFTEDTCTLTDVINFQCPYWEEKLMRKLNLNGKTFSFISPSGQLAMRLAHPLYSQFEKLPYAVDLDSEERSERIGQSSGDKWWNVAKCRSFVLNNRPLYQGDTFLLSDRAVRFNQFFKNEKNVYVQAHIYSEEADFRASPSNESFVSLVPHIMNDQQIAENINIEYFENIRSLREQNITCRLSRFKFTKSENDLNFVQDEITEDDDILTPVVPQSILEEGHCVITGINVHLDDASMNPQSKVWKKATCVSQQLAGAPSGLGGWKHGDNGTMLLTVAPAQEMTPIEVLRSMEGEFNILQNGFQAYDYEAKKVVKVKAGICVFEGDLDSQRQLTPFKGAAGYSYCHRDMMNKDSSVQDEEDLVMRTRGQLDAQIDEISNAATQAEKKELCRQYGLVPSRYPPITDMFREFDLFSDLACDTLHLILLGVNKKFLISLKQQLPDAQLQKAAALLDSVMLPILYKNRPSGNIILHPASQIGRSVKSAFQVLYFGLHHAGCDQKYSRAAFNLAEVNLMLFTESDTIWDVTMLNRLKLAIQRCLATIERYFEECVSPKSHYVKKHILTDIKNHGNPSSFNCQGGERKIKCQKICQAYSNKHNTNRDSTKKLISVETARHIMTGGIFSDTGEKCGTGVESFCQNNPCQDYLGLLKDPRGTKLTLGDYRNKGLKQSRPPTEHVLAGCPNIFSSTWKRLNVNGIKIARGGGVKYRQRNHPEQVGLVKQMYKNGDGVFVIVNKLVPVLCDDQFLSFTESRLYDRSESCILVDNLASLKPHVLLHACNLEENPCAFVRSGEKYKLECVGGQGLTFLHNRVALARCN